MATRRHECEVVEPGGGKRKVTWVNTNRLLDIEGYEGVKTGTTTPAGNCLVACGKRGEDRLIVVVLGSTAADGRYVDAQQPVPLRVAGTRPQARAEEWEVTAELFLVFASFRWRRAVGGARNGRNPVRRLRIRVLGAARSRRLMRRRLDICMASVACLNWIPQRVDSPPTACRRW